MSQAYTIEVNRISVEKTGKRGEKPWTLYRLEDWRWVGPQPAFLRANVPFKTFDSLSGSVEVTVEPYEKDGTLQHYTVKAKHRPAARRNGGPPTGDLEARVSQLESEVVALHRKLDAAIRAFGEE